MFSSEMIAIYLKFFINYSHYSGLIWPWPWKYPQFDLLRILDVNKKYPLEKFVQRDILYVAVRCLLIAIYQQIT